MHHTKKKGNQWHFGMKAHIGVDVASGVVHTVVGTAANEVDINQTAPLLHGQEEAVFADAGHTGADKRPEHEDRDVSRNIAIKRSIIKALPKDLQDLAEAVERPLSQASLFSTMARSIPAKPRKRRSPARAWLTIEWLPKYAPELNDIERSWRDPKRHFLAHQTFADVDHLDRAIHKAICRHEPRAPIPLCTNLRIAASNALFNRCKGQMTSMVECLGASGAERPSNGQDC